MKTHTAPVKKEITVTAFGSVYYFEHGKNFRHPPEKHDTWEMVYIDRGAAIAVSEGIGSLIEEGEAVFYEPMELHCHISDSQKSNNMFVVSFKAEGESMSFFKKRRIRFDDASKRLLSLFLEEAGRAMGKIQGDYIHRFPIEFDSAEFGSTHLMAAYLEELLIKLIRNGEEAGSTLIPSELSREIGNNSTAELICDFLKRNLYSEIDLNILCKHFYMGKSCLSAIFKEYTGLSPIHYFNEEKIKEAKKLIRESNMSIGEIAEALNFSGIHSFSRSFKNSTGFSPTGYKKSIR